MLESPTFSSFTSKSPFLNKFNFDFIIEKLGINRFTIRVYFFIALFFMVDGSEMMVLSLLMKKLTNEFELTSFEKGSLGSSIFIGFASGSLFSGYISDKKGRRPAYLLGSTLVMIFALLSAFAQGFFSFVILRMICGFGIGVAIPALFALATEITPKEYRAAVLNNVWSIFPIGAAFVIIITKFLIDVQNGWRYILFFASLPCAILLMFSKNVPESPRFYFSNQQYEKGFEQLQKIVEFCKNDEIILNEQNKQSLIEEAESKKANLMEVKYETLIYPEYRKITILICIIFFIVSLNYYGALYIFPQIFEKEQEETKNVRDVYLSLLFGCFLEVPSYFLGGYLANHRYLLRIKTMILGFAVNMISAVVILIYPQGITFFSALFKCSVAISFTVVFVYACEAYPTKIRSLGVGTGHSFTRMAAILTPFIMQFLFDFYHKLPFIFFIFGSITGILSCFALPFETYGLNLE